MTARPVPALPAALTIATAASFFQGSARAAEDRAGLVEMLDADADADADADGRLSRAELRMTALAPSFAALDANGGGTLDRRELKAIGVRMPPRSSTAAP